MNGLDNLTQKILSDAKGYAGEVKQASDEKMSDLKRGNESRRGYSRRGQQK